MPYITNEGWNTLPEQVEENKKNIATLANVIATTKTTPKGAWQSSIAYEAGDLVTYNHKTYEYIYATSTAGTLPTNTTYWKVVIDPEGGGVNWMGTWVSGSDHYENDIVKYNRDTYICIQDVDPSVVNPELDTTHWAVFVPAGVSVSSIVKTATSGLTDTYTITYSDATTSTFQIKNGKSITSIAKTSTSGLVDTYTITYNNSTTTTFTVTNGQDGNTTVYDDNGSAVAILEPTSASGGISIDSSGNISTTMTNKHLYFHPVSFNGIGKNIAIIIINNVSTSYAGNTSAGTFDTQLANIISWMTTSSATNFNCSGAYYIDATHYFVPAKVVLSASTLYLDGRDSGNVGHTKDSNQLTINGTDFLNIVDNVNQLF